MNNEENIENAKAIQEVAKTTNKVLTVLEKLGSFMGDTVEDGVGILKDKLQHMRWERQIRFIDKVEEINKKRNIENKTQLVQPKILLPIIENASLEQIDELQDLWAKLLSSFQEETKNEITRSSFVDILKQLETIDANFLKVIYDASKHNHHSKNYYYEKYKLTKFLNINSSQYDNIVDNLMRLRLIRSFIAELEYDSYIKSNLYHNDEIVQFTKDLGYDGILLTELGKNFIESCIID